MGRVVSPVDALLAQVYDGHRYKPFGEFTLADVEARATELGAAAGAGPTVRVAPVARAWAQLGREMQAARAVVVADLAPELVSDLAHQAWVLPPEGGFL